VLDKDEWSKMSNGESYDRNHDGKVTLDEMVETLKPGSHASDDAAADKSSSTPAAGGDNSSRGGGADNGGGFRNRRGGGPGGGFGRDSFGGGRNAPSGGAKRAVSRVDRLPQGLGNRFFQLDTDGDGQISMSEYATTWTAEKAAEFAKFDRNGDGIITADEWLKAEPPQ
ncbi:MAG TPA: hypothetical protein VGI75_00780, partial [Pirellulales bacterium]